jgi:hypothetical protein
VWLHKRLKWNNIDKNKKLCDEIYKKLPMMLKKDNEHNSYFYEELCILYDLENYYQEDQKKSEERYYRVHNLILEVIKKEAKSESKFWGSKQLAEYNLNKEINTRKNIQDKKDGKKEDNSVEVL